MKEVHDKIVIIGSGPAGLTAAVYDWGPYYTKRVDAAMKGTWKSGFYYGNMKDGMVKLAPFGPKVSAKTKAAIANRKRAIVKGTYQH